MSRSLARQAILNTLAYAAVFGSRVPRKFLPRYLVSPVNISEDELDVALGQLQEEKKIKVVDKTSLFPFEKWQSVWRARDFFRRVPWVQSIWVTGGLAINNIADEDDVDFMIITDPNRMWLCRFLIVGIGGFFGKVRLDSESHQLKNKWCCNLWLESSDLGMKTNQKSLYIAREIVQAVPVWQRSPGQAEKFLLENAWAQKLSFSGWHFAQQRAHSLPAQPLKTLWWNGNFFTWLNEQLGSWQRRRMLTKQQRETVEIHRAFFHPQDRGSVVLAKYEKIHSLLK